MYCTKCHHTTYGRPPKYDKKKKIWWDQCGKCKSIQQVHPKKASRDWFGNRCPDCGLLLSVGSYPPQLDRGVEFHIFKDCPGCNALVYD